MSRNAGNIGSTGAGLVAALASLAAFVTPAGASASGVLQRPQWTVTAVAVPTNFAPGSEGVYRIAVVNTGEAPSDGSTITINDVLPSGLTPVGGASAQELWHRSEYLSCTGPTCSYKGAVGVGDLIAMTVPVKVGVQASGTVVNEVSVSGGGAPEATVRVPTTISSQPASAGIAPGSTATTLSTTQAGGHPDLTTALAFNSVNANTRLAGSAREVVGDLPPGFAGDVADTPACPIAEFSENNGGNVPQHCPLSSQVGTIYLELNFGGAAELEVLPIYNLAHDPGEVAKLGFKAPGVGVQGEVSLRPGDYAVQTSFENINNTIAEFDGSILTIWGVPASPLHDPMRGRICGRVGSCDFVNATEAFLELERQSVSTPQVPYLTSPTQCTDTPLQATLSATFWQQPGFRSSVPSAVGPLTGCNLMEFTPSFTASPDTTASDTPAGLTVDVKVPQEGLTASEGLSAADIRNTTVTLPAGVVVNPGQAAGLQACLASQENLEAPAPPSCPSASKVGQDEIATPLLKEKLEGNVYVLQSNPPDLKLLVEASQPSYGIYVKLTGDVHLNESTGQLVTTFEETPELPFTDFKLSFSGGAQAALATPISCGTYATTSDFSPWSAPATLDGFPTSGFAITEGPGGGACPSSPLPFSPSLIAGSTTDQAGGFTGFSLLLRSGDGQQRIEKLQFKVPKGLVATLAGIPLCPEPQASKGECSEASKIGHSTVASGPGPYPLVIPQPGEPESPIYLTGPYDGAPFGLSIVTHVIAGPFNLGTIITRAKIEIDQTTAQITVTTEPLPQIVMGVPTDLRLVDAVIDRPNFMFNPTNCEPMSFAGTASGTPPPGVVSLGANASIESRFQVGDCGALGFNPRFSVATVGKPSRSDGVGLDVKLSYPSGSFGKEANIAKVRVELPKQLPSRLTTLQKACPDSVFNADPATCPAASRVGEAVGRSPIVPVPLSGPAYFVSHGGAKFPELIIILSGYGVTVHLHGETFINKEGVTSSTFNTVPDVPIESFELKLPAGPDSALAAHGDLCASKLVMPTSFEAQNGASLHMLTSVSVGGCRPALRVLRRRVRGRSTTLTVSVPSAGRLVASGGGVIRVVKRTGKAGEVALKLTLSSKSTRKLFQQHPGRKIAARIKLRFTPKRGQAITSSVTVTLG